MDRIYSEMTSLQYENRALRKEIESFRNGERYKKLQQDHHQVIAGYERKISQLKKDLEKEHDTRKRVRNLWINQCQKDYESYQAELEKKNRKLEKLEKKQLETRQRSEKKIASLIQSYEEKLEEKQIRIATVSDYYMGEAPEETHQFLLNYSNIDIESFPYAMKAIRELL